VLCAEIVVRLRRPTTVFPTRSPAQNYFRFRISPEVTGAFGPSVMDPEEKMIGQHVELLASHHPGAEEMDAYERVLGDAMQAIVHCLPERIMLKRPGASSTRC
jgi:glucose-6-phosphate 1-dehydrogenase